MLTMQGGDSLVGGLPIIHITYQQYIANPSAYHDPDVIFRISGYPTAGNLPADYVGYDSNLNMEDIGNIATKAIAKVEPSDTALYLHNVGEGFINKDGNYCITDVQISVGGTITLGTNCHVVDGGISSNAPKITGTGNAALYTALASLSNDNFAKSTLKIEFGGNVACLKPFWVSNKIYNVINASSSRVYTLYEVSTSQARERAKNLDGTITDTALTISNWAIYY